LCVEVLHTSEKGSCVIENLRCGFIKGSTYSFTQVIS
jgi:hypothetical protein